MRSDVWPPRPEMAEDEAPSHPDTFPIMHSRVAALPWTIVEAHRVQIERNHGQTLERLTERGGIDAVEMSAAMKGMNPWQGTLLKLEDCDAMLERRVESWRRGCAQR